MKDQLKEAFDKFGNNILESSSYPAEKTLLLMN